MRTFALAAVLALAAMNPLVAQEERLGSGAEPVHVEGATGTVGGAGLSGNADPQGAGVGNSGDVRAFRFRKDDAGKRGDASGSTPRVNSGSPPSGHDFKEGGSQRGASGQIDLMTPDGGYAGLRRRAERKSLIANAAKKTTPPGVTVYGSAHNLAFPWKTDLSIRNSIGTLQPKGAGAEPSWTLHSATVPLVPPRTVITTGSANGGSPAGDLGSDGHRAPNCGVPANSLNAPHNSVGINGTTFGRVASGSGAIGGPAKDRSAINGNAFRPRFK